MLQQQTNVNLGSQSNSTDFNHSNLADIVNHSRKENNVKKLIQADTKHERINEASISEECLAAKSTIKKSESFKELDIQKAAISSAHNCETRKKCEENNKLLSVSNLASKVENYDNSGSNRSQSSSWQSNENTTFITKTRFRTFTASSILSTVSSASSSACDEDICNQFLYPTLINWKRCGDSYSSCLDSISQKFSFSTTMFQSHYLFENHNSFYLQ